MVPVCTMELRFHHSAYIWELVIETNAFHYVSAGVLWQCYIEKVLNPVVYSSITHTSAEYNYDIYDKELMAIVIALEDWGAECKWALWSVQLLIDYKNLEYLMTRKLLNQRQAQWLEFLSYFNYNIVYREAKSNGNIDGLTIKLGDLPKWGGGWKIKNYGTGGSNATEPGWTLLFFEGSLPSQGHSNWSNLFTEENISDLHPAKLQEAIETNVGSKKVQLQNVQSRKEEFNIVERYMCRKIIHSSDNSCRNTINQHSHSIGDTWRPLIPCTASNIGSNCKWRWISMYETLTTRSYPGGDDIGCLEFTNISQYQRDHRIKFPWIS